MRLRAALLVACALVVQAPAAEAKARRASASWYGPGFHGRLMANGQRFDMRSNTVAHKTLRLGTRIVVSNPRNGRRAVAVVRDRGPYVRGRELDLSRGLAVRLRALQAGVIPVTYRVIHKPARPITFHRRPR